MDSVIINTAMILETSMPISLKEASYEYHYGIFANEKAIE